MQRVLVACVAGASSTFLARRLGELAQSEDIDLSFVPTPIESLGATNELVALSSHVATTEVLVNLTSAGIRYVVLPENVRGAFGAEDALSTIASFIHDEGATLGSPVESLSLKGHH
jgi:galactitol-specific phosphotransferase system IIB component